MVFLSWFQPRHRARTSAPPVLTLPQRLAVVVAAVTTRTKGNNRRKASNHRNNSNRHTTRTKGNNRRKAGTNNRPRATSHPRSNNRRKAGTNNRARDNRPLVRRHTLLTRHNRPITSSPVARNRPQPRPVERRATFYDYAERLTLQKLLYHQATGRHFTGHPPPNSPFVQVDAADLPRHTKIETGLGMSEVLPSLDFETYSAAGYYLNVENKIKGLGGQGKGGLPVVGTPAYAEHESTEVLCLYYNLKDGRGRRGWFPGTPPPVDLFDYIGGGGLVEAWNVSFEFYIWNLVCVKKYGWPVLPLEQCRCAMAKSRRFSLPGGLDNAAKVLGGPPKDPEGKRLIQKLTRPHTPTKNREAIRHTQATAWGDFLKLYAYCDQDTVAEDNVAAMIPDLTAEESEVWELDQKINARGVAVDVLALDAALDILKQAENRYTTELQRVTGGRVGSVSEVENMRQWLNEQGVAIPDIQADTVSEFLKLDHVQGPARRVLEIRACLGAANVKKLRTLKLQINSDGRLRNQYSYCGADRTGRWSAGGVQLQNITAKGPIVYRCEDMNCGKHFGNNPADCCPHCGSPFYKSLAEWTVESVEFAIADILTRNLDHVERVWRDPIEVLCGCLRGLFIAEEGKELICCDFSSIEAVVAATLSRCMWRVETFAQGDCIYTLSASKITGKPVEEYKAYKTEHGMHHPDRKKIGKIAELASGYGGWINAWLGFGCEMDDAETKAAILAWREASPEIVEMWGGQFRQVGAKPWDAVPELYGLEGAAINAIRNPGQCFSHTDITYGVWDDVLYCRLPSGRFLHYHRPRLIPAEDKLKRGPAVSITFEGYNSNSEKGRVGWGRLETFGGRLFENVVQAVARDVQAFAMLNAEGAGYPIVMHTHDELTAELPTGRGSVEELQQIMARRPPWAEWWPIKAAGWRHKRYQKD